jgi:hypothetical protein
MYLFLCWYYLVDNMPKPIYDLKKNIQLHILANRFVQLTGIVLSSRLERSLQLNGLFVCLLFVCLFFFSCSQD